MFVEVTQGKPLTSVNLKMKKVFVYLSQPMPIKSVKTKELILGSPWTLHCDMREYSLLASFTSFSTFFKYTVVSLDNVM